MGLTLCCDEHSRMSFLWTMARVCLGIILAVGNWGPSPSFPATREGSLAP
jgi:hypothetical protein